MLKSLAGSKCGYFCCYLQKKAVWTFAIFSRDASGHQQFCRKCLKIDCCISYVIGVNCRELQESQIAGIPAIAGKLASLFSRVGILARLRVTDPLFFLWMHKFQLKLTITRPLGRACIHNGVKISHEKSLKMSQFVHRISKYRVTCS